MQQPLPFSPDADLDLYWNWAPWLGTALLSGSATITPPAGVTVHDQAQAGGVVSASVRLSKKMVAGTLLPIKCHVVTNDTPPRADTRTITLIVTDR